MMTEEIFDFAYDDNRVVCHTIKECRVVYNSIPMIKRNAAIEFLRDFLSLETKETVMMCISDDPKNWIAPYHFYWGKWVRNQLRSAGMDEEYFGIHSLDYIYVWLIEEAVLYEKI